MMMSNVARNQVRAYLHACLRACVFLGVCVRACVRVCAIIRVLGYARTFRFSSNLQSSRTFKPP